MSGECNAAAIRVETVAMPDFVQEHMAVCVVGEFLRRMALSPEARRLLNDFDAKIDAAATRRLLYGD